MEETIEEIEQAIYRMEHRKRFVIQAILNIVFWKDYHSGLVKYNDIQEMFQIADEATDSPKGYIKYDKDKVFTLANRIREAIGLPTLEFEGGLIIEEPKENENEQRQ